MASSTNKLTIREFLIVKELAKTVSYKRESTLDDIAYKDNTEIEDEL